MIEELYTVFFFKIQIFVHQLNKNFSVYYTYIINSLFYSKNNGINNLFPLTGK